MSDLFDPTAMQAALEELDTTSPGMTSPVPEETTNIATDANGADDNKVDAAEKARAHGFVERVPYDYSIYTSGRNDAEGGATSAAPAWLADAAVYEWLDEYGEVGPPIPELEMDLFGSDYRMQSGPKLDAFKYFVTTEAAEPVHPIREVRKTKTL